MGSPTAYSASLSGLNGFDNWFGPAGDAFSLGSFQNPFQHTERGICLFLQWVDWTVGFLKGSPGWAIQRRDHVTVIAKNRANRKTIVIENNRLQRRPFGARDGEVFNGKIAVIKGMRQSAVGGFHGFQTA